MYLRESKQTRTDGTVVTYLQLAENVWDAAKGRSQAHIVHNCGRSDDVQVVERLRRLAKSILRRCSPEEIVGAGGDWKLICAWPYGDIYVLEAIWKQLGIDAVVRQQTGSRHFGFDVERALFALVANRACTPVSKLYCHEQWLKPDFDTAKSHACRRAAWHKAFGAGAESGVYLGGDCAQSKVMIGLGDLIFNDFNLLAACGVGSVTCQTRPFGLDNCAN